MQLFPANSGLATRRTAYAGPAGPRKPQQATLGVGRRAKVEVRGGQLRWSRGETLKLGRSRPISPALRRDHADATG
jgi:hypothetical protein